jgi:CRP-like cAMP-binding protein
VRPGEVVLHEEEAATSFYIVTGGEVEIEYAGQDGRPQRLARIGPGGFFGEVGCLTGRSDGTVRALVPGELIVFERKGFVELMARSPVVRQDVEAQMKRLHELRYATRPQTAVGVGPSGGL